MTKPGLQLRGSESKCSLISVASWPWSQRNRLGGDPIEITPVNDAPVVTHAPALLQATEDTAFSLLVDRAGFADVDSNALTHAVTSANGSALPNWLRFDGAGLTGTPPADFNGRVPLRLTASDGTLSSSTPLVLEVAAVNDVPRAGGRSIRAW